jgi:hypothetical protein
VAPDLLQQRLPRHRPLAGAVEITQDRGLLLGQADLVALGVEEELRAWPERIGLENGATMGEIVDALKKLWGTYREMPVFDARDAGLCAGCTVHWGAKLGVALVVPQNAGKD